HFSLLLLCLRNSNSQHTILHPSLHLIHLRILRQPEPPHELPAAPLHPVPLIVLLLLLFTPLSANLQYPPFFHLHLHFFLLQPRHIRFKHMSLRSLFPVDPRVHKRRCLTRRCGQLVRDCGEGSAGSEEVFEGVPNVEGEWIEDVAPAVAEDARNQRHDLACRLKM
ncbi:hypothetical protein LINPERHAP1_LOCUS27714, partial [Linum perenne]